MTALVRHGYAAVSFLRRQTRVTRSAALSDTNGLSVCRSAGRRRASDPSPWALFIGVSARLTVRFAVAGLIGTTAVQADAPPDARPDPRLVNPVLTVRHLTGSAYWVEGGVASTGFVIGDRGVIVIDAQMFEPAARNVLAQIAALTTKPVNEMILTHSDPDHINGLPAYPLTMEIIAQRNAKREMIEALADQHPNFTPPPPALRDYLPTRTVARRARVILDGLHVELLYSGPAHTDGDLIAYFPDQGIVYAGDLLTPAVGPYPSIHPNKHGTSLGWIHAVKAMLVLKADVFVSGHGKPLTRAEVRSRLLAAEERRAEIKSLVGKGMSLAAVRAALHDQPNSGLAARFPTFTQTTYEELVPTVTAPLNSSHASGAQ